MPNDPFFTPEPLDEAEWLVTAGGLLRAMPSPLASYVLHRYHNYSAEQSKEVLGVPEHELREQLDKFLLRALDTGVMNGWVEAWPVSSEWPSLPGEDGRDPQGANESTQP